MATRTGARLGAVRYVPDRVARLPRGVREAAERVELVSAVEVTDRGPDVLLRLEVRGMPARGTVEVAADMWPEIARRLFAEPPTPAAAAAFATWREDVGALVQELEDAAGAQDVALVTEARRRLLRAVGALVAAAGGPAA